MEFTTAHLQFVKSTAHFNQPLKTELKKNPTFLWDPKYFYPKFLVRLNIFQNKVVLR